MRFGEFVKRYKEFKSIEYDHTGNLRVATKERSYYVDEPKWLRKWGYALAKVICQQTLKDIYKRLRI